jgi:hypothetical protein
MIFQLILSPFMLLEVSSVYSKVQINLATIITQLIKVIIRAMLIWLANLKPFKGIPIHIILAIVIYSLPPPSFISTVPPFLSIAAAYFPVHLNYSRVFAIHLLCLPFEFIFE